MATDKTSKKPPNGCEIKPCNCRHAGQDEMYGKGMRLKNQTAKGTGDARGYRCTVCNRDS